MRNLEALEHIAKELLDTLSSYELDHDEAFYIIGYMERALLMDLFEQTLEDYGLIEISDYDEEDLEGLEEEEEGEEEEEAEGSSDEESGEGGDKE